LDDIIKYIESDEKQPPSKAKVKKKKKDEGGSMSLAEVDCSSSGEEQNQVEAGQAKKKKRRRNKRKKKTAVGDGESDMVDVKSSFDELYDIVPLGPSRVNNLSVHSDDSDTCISKLTDTEFDKCFMEFVLRLERISRHKGPKHKLVPNLSSAWVAKYAL
jgi:hypothetical protein